MDASKPVKHLISFDLWLGKNLGLPDLLVLSNHEFTSRFRSRGEKESGGRTSLISGRQNNLRMISEFPQDFCGNAW
jgi:hypothetical protein